MMRPLRCRLGWHPWTAGSPWREVEQGVWYTVRSCNACGPLTGGWREFWTPVFCESPAQTFERVYEPGAVLVASTERGPACC